MSISAKAQAKVKSTWDTEMAAAQASTTSKRKAPDPVGMTGREVAVALGMSDRRGIARVAATLSKAWQSGKLDRKEIEGVLRYQPNAHTGSDYRYTSRTPTGQSTRAPSLAQVQPKESPVRKARFIPPPTKPTAEQVAQLTSLFAKPAPRNNATGPMPTSEDFIAAGGVIQILPPGASSRKPHIFADDDNFAP